MANPQPPRPTPPRTPKKTNNRPQPRPKLLTMLPIFISPSTYTFHRATQFANRITKNTGIYFTTLRHKGDQWRVTNQHDPRVKKP